MAPDKKVEKKDSDNGNEMLKRYIAMFPFIRKEELGELAANPNKALPKEIESSTVGRGLHDAIVTALIFTTVASLFWLIFSIPALMLQLGNITTIAVMVIPVYVVSLLIAVVSTAVCLLVTAGVYHILAKLLGGKGTFDKTMGMLGSITGPINLLHIALLVLSSILMAIVYFIGFSAIASVIVVLGYIALVFFNLYLNYKMVRMLHGLSRGRAVVVIAMPILALIAIVLAFLAWIIITLGSMVAMVPH